MVNPNDYFNVKKVLDDNNIKILSSEIKLIPNSTVDISEEDETKLNRFIDQCDDDEDIQWVVSNVGNII